MSINEHLSVVVMLIDSLCRAGVKNYCVSPGSRSTPLTIAVARNLAAKVWTMPDERSAGFFALGIARATGEPVALICTSGTAAGNYVPAIMEASRSRTPLIVLTADRPAELVGVGSNQTVDQRHLFTSHVKRYIEMPTPTADESLAGHARATASRAVGLALSAPQGPVHINWPLREPLLPPLIADGCTGNAGAPVVTVYRGQSIPAPNALAPLLQVLKASPRGLIVCGPMNDRAEALAVRSLAHHLGYPVLADPLSQLRTLAGKSALVIDAHDVFLRGVFKEHTAHRAQVLQPYRPQVVLRFGQTPISKAVGQYLMSLDAVPQVVIDPSSGDWSDPFFTATDVVAADASAFLMVCQAHVEPRDPSAVAQAWRRLNEAMQQTLPDALNGLSGMFEGAVFPALAQLLPEDSVLFVGNSMPVRDLDSFLSQLGRSVHVMANRGASGIDGVVSTALGVAAGVGQPVVLVIGDLSFYHDLNGLLAAKLHGLSATVILINNDGGGIFSFLPPATQPDVTEYFFTPHGLDFAPVVAMYGGRFTRIEDWDGFADSVQAALHRPGLDVLEIRTERDDNVRMHDQVYERCFREMSER